MKKRLLKTGSFLLAFLLLAITLCNAQVFARESSQKAPTKTTIRVGYTEKGMMIRKQDGQFVGYGVDYLKLLSKFTNWDYEFIPVKESKRIQDLKDCNIDLLCDLSEDETEIGEVLFSADKSSLHYALLCAPKEDTSVFYNEFSAINNKRIAINKSRKMGYMMEDFAELHDISYTPVYCKSMSEMERAIASGKADMMVVSNQRDLSNYKYVAKVGLRNQYFAVSRKQSDLLLALNEADKQVKLAYPFIISQLYDKWYGRPAEVLVGETREEYNFIKNETPVRVIYDSDSFPVEYTDEKSNSFKGIYADAINLIQKATGLNFQFIPVDNYLDAWTMLKNGEADMSTGTYLTRDLTEKYGLISSASHLTEKHTLILRTDKTLNESLTLVIPEEDIDIQAFVKEEYPGVKIITGKSITSCLEMADKGNADGTLINSVFLQTVYNFSNYKNLLVIPMHSVDVPISFSFGGEHAKLLRDMINKVIRQIPASSFEKCIVENSVEVIYEPTVIEMLWKLMPALVVIIGSFILFYMLSLYSREKHYHHLAMTDSVTGLHNGISFRQQLKETLSRNHEKDYQLISMDIEHFRYANTDYGEKSADLLLQTVSQRIQECFGNGAVCAREMGDNFLILSSPTSNTEELLGRLRSTITFYKNGMPQHYKPNIKSGICYIDAKEPRLPINEYIDRANAARKSIKGDSLTKFACFDSDMAQTLLNEMKIEKKMTDALSNEEFQVYYQPKYNLQTNHLAGAEALVRWQDPEEGMIFPNTFIPVFERNGFIVQLDFFVYEKVLETLSRWIKKGLEPITVSVNVSRAHIGTGDFISRLVKLADSFHVPHNLLELELTETVLGGSHQDILDFIQDCRNAGFPISIDDFGSGYSSLNLLKELPIDVVKIDRDFLNESEVSEKTSIIIEQIVMMAEKINIHTLCEGVETQSQAAFLRSIGCNLAQGYLYSKPVPIEAFEAMM